MTPHELIDPFDISNTARWRERERIRQALQAISNASDEALQCLPIDVDQRLLWQAQKALEDLEKAITKLHDNATHV